MYLTWFLYEYWTYLLNRAQKINHLFCENYLCFISYVSCFKSPFQYPLVNRTLLLGNESCPWANCRGVCDVGTWALLEDQKNSVQSLWCNHCQLTQN